MLLITRSILNCIFRITEQKYAAHRYSNPRNPSTGMHHIFVNLCRVFKISSFLPGNP